MSLRNNLLICVMFLLVACTSAPAPFQAPNISPPVAVINETPSNITVPFVEPLQNTSNASIIPETTNNSDKIIVQPGNVVEFFVAPLGKPYVKDILREDQIRTYNVTGEFITVMPIIIASEGVIMSINNLTSRSLGEKESDVVGGFDLYIDNIYTR